jgi:capsule polysaccharide export protein KpsC/LpsZ
MLSPLMVTHEQAKQYCEARQQGRRANMAQHEISTFWATAYRMWELAPDELKAQVRAQPDFEEDENE